MRYGICQRCGLKKKIREVVDDPRGKGHHIEICKECQEGE